MPPLTAYAVMRLGRVRLLPYFMPGDPAMGDAVRGLAGEAPRGPARQPRPGGGRARPRGRGLCDGGARGDRAARASHRRHVAAPADPGRGRADRGGVSPTLSQPMPALTPPPGGEDDAEAHGRTPMKLATLRNGSPDGRLVVVSRDLTRCSDARHIAPTLQAALDAWATAAPQLELIARGIEAGAQPIERFHERDALRAPAPRPRRRQPDRRTPRHDRASATTRPPSPPASPRSSARCRRAPTRPPPAPPSAWSCSRASSPPAEPARGLTAFSPVAVTPDETGPGLLVVELNGAPFSRTASGADAAALVAAARAACRRRPRRPGTGPRPAGQHPAPPRRQRPHRDARRRRPLDLRRHRARRTLTPRPTASSRISAPWPATAPGRTTGCSRPARGSTPQPSPPRASASSPRSAAR